MSKRTEQRLRARIRELEQINEQHVRRIVDLAAPDHYEPTGIVEHFRWEGLPQWMKIAAQTAWACEGRLSIHQGTGPDSFILRVMRRVR